jgi:hypothetical protein
MSFVGGRLYSFFHRHRHRQQFVVREEWSDHIQYETISYIRTYILVYLSMFARGSRIMCD